MKSFLRTGLQASVLVIALAFASPEASALVAPGGALPSLTLVDAWERTLDLDKLRGRPVVLIYEDKEAASQNAAFKRDLGALMKEERFKALVMVPIADVSSYDFFPAKKFARDAIRDQSKKIGIPIYCDWNGRIGRELGSTKKSSHIVLLGRKGNVLFAHAGALGKSESDAFAAKLAADPAP